MGQAVEHSHSNKRREVGSISPGGSFVGSMRSIRSHGRCSKDRGPGALRRSVESSSVTPSMLVSGAAALILSKQQRLYFLPLPHGQGSVAAGSTERRIVEA